MHADELRRAVNKIVEVLKKADILAVVSQYRAAQGDQRTVAAARFGHAGAVIMENMENLSPTERAVVRCMSLEDMGSATYWQSLLQTTGEPRQNAAQLVHLASRVMFASNHLPNLVKLLGSVETATHAGQRALQTGEGGLTIRLTDAGERATDPDRIARSVDGIDMLYSACASIARKPAMDLRLDGIDGKTHKDIHFTGEHDSISAVMAVIESIPLALEEYGAEQDIDLDELVSSLPIFHDLNTLAELGTFSANDLKDISETMHTGAMLALESGVILLEQPAATASAAGRDIHSQPAVAAKEQPPEQSPATQSAEPPILRQRVLNSVATPGAPKAPVNDNGAAAEDEHYSRYLREREAMQQQNANGLGDMAVDEQQRSDAVDELLRNLGRARG